MSEPKPKWWSGVITIQTGIYILAAFVWAVIFWKNTAENWDKTKLLETVIKKVDESKPDNETFKALSDRVVRQYELINKQNDRIAELEKEAAYQKGLHEAKRHNE